MFVRHQYTVHCQCITAGRQEVEARSLVPGDLLLLSSETTGELPCDVALLGAGECVVQEAALTGESAPATKARPLKII